MNKLFEWWFEAWHHTGKYDGPEEVNSAITTPLNRITKLAADYQSRKKIFDAYRDAMRNSRAGLELFAENLQDLCACAAVLSQNVDTVKKHGGWFGSFCIPQKVIQYSGVIQDYGQALPEIQKGLANKIPKNNFQISEILFEESMQLVHRAGGYVDAMNATAAQCRTQFEKNYKDMLELLKKPSPQMSDWYYSGRFY